MPRPMQMARADRGAKDFKKAIINLIKYCKSYAIPMIAAMLLAVVGAAMSIIGPDRLGDLTNLITKGIMTGIDMDAVTETALFLVLIYGIGIVCNYAQGFIMATVTQRITNNMRRDISVKLNVLPLKYFDGTTYGDVLSRVTNDVDLVGQALNQSVVTIVSSITMLIGVLIMMFTINWIMAFTAIGSTLIGFGIMIIIMSRSQKYFIRQQNALGDINGQVEEVYSGHNVVKAYNAEPFVREKFGKTNKILYNSAWKSQFMSGLMMPLMGFIGNFGYVAVCVVGGALTLSGKTDLGTIVSFMLYVRLFSSPLSQLAQVMTQLQSAAAAGERVFEFLDEKEMEDESGKTRFLDTVKGDVMFEHVKFGYNEDRTIIKDFSAEIKAGSKVAIVGPTGAGKTTMVNLLMRFYEINSGSIKIDGVPLNELTRANVHSLFGMVLQDTWLFEASIRENIIYSKQNVSDEDVEKACKAAGLDHFIRTLPDGYDTVIDDKTGVSAGQKQLITIARAMVENAPMLILDEATSSVDTRTEEIIQKAMDKLTEGRTSFVIAHRLSTIKNSDMILVMKDGDIIENGTHDELLNKGGFYAELYNSQFSNAAGDCE